MLQQQMYSLNEDLVEQKMFKNQNERRYVNKDTQYCIQIESCL